ncbi:MAG: two component transcriptional regulator, LuxR family [Solirubrobacterales bacterium]|nr:two component transcriptional regulator, LuxR family [Solirubrobacterales bacterium]
MLTTATRWPKADAITTLLVDDNTLFRQGTRLLMRAHDITVLGEASNGRDAVRLAAELRPDVVVMDMDMPVMDGIQATSLISGGADAPSVLVLASVESNAALDAILAGARGLLLKESDGAQIAAGVRLAAAGQSALSPSIAGLLVRRMRELETARRAHAPRRADAGLTAREQDVLRLLTAGRDNPGIGEELYISSSTVKHHVASILDKLEVHNRVQAAVEAVRIGLA